MLPRIFQQSCNTSHKIIANNTEFDRFISSWISTSPSLSIIAVLLQVDDTCPSTVQSFSDPECGVVTEGITTATSKSMINLSTQSNELSILIIGGAVGFVVMVLFLLCCVFIIIIILIVLLLKKLKSDQYTYVLKQYICYHVRHKV